MPMADTRFSNRRRRLATELASQRLDALLVTDPIHVRYLTGFTGSNGGLLLAKDLSAIMATDGRYTTQIAQEVPDIEAIDARAVGPGLLKQAQAGSRIGIEAAHTSVAELGSLEESAPEGVSLVPVTDLVENIRLVKDEVELQRLEEVSLLANDALQALVDSGELRAGRSEREVAADLEYRMRLAGSERVSFDTIVASGPNSAKPHHGAEDRIIERGDLVTIDYGAFSRGFNSDCTRTFGIGELGEFEREIYDIVLRAQLAGVEAAVAGAKLVDVDAACRQLITDEGYGEYFVHSTGHGIGLEVHEGPAAARTGRGELAPGMTLTIEPGIYVPGRGGVRIEDTLIITEGAPKIITPMSKELTIL